MSLQNSFQRNKSESICVFEIEESSKVGGTGNLGGSQSFSSLLTP